MGDTLPHRQISIRLPLRLIEFWPFLMAMKLCESWIYSTAVFGVAVAGLLAGTMFAVWNGFVETELLPKRYALVCGDGTVGNCVGLSTCCQVQNGIGNGCGVLCYGLFRCQDFFVAVGTARDCVGIRCCALASVCVFQCYAAALGCDFRGPGDTCVRGTGHLRDIAVCRIGATALNIPCGGVFR